MQRKKGSNWIEMIIKMVNEFKLTVVHFARPNPMQICACAWIYRWTKRLWKIRTGPPGRWASGPRGRRGPWAAGRWAFGPPGRWAAGMLLTKPQLRPHCLRRTSYPLLLNYLKTQQCYLDFAEIVSFKTFKSEHW